MLPKDSPKNALKLSKAMAKYYKHLVVDKAKLFDESANKYQAAAAEFENFQKELSDAPENLKQTEERVTYWEKKIEDSKPKPIETSRKKTLEDLLANFSKEEIIKILSAADQL